MQNPTWKDKIKKLVKEGCTDSDIRDLIDEYPKEARNIWIFVAELSAPEECKGCKHIQRSGTYPCNCCSRRVEVEDYFEKRED